MLNAVYVGNNKFNIDPNKIIASGGEADLYMYSSTEVIKIYKTPDHPSLTGLPIEQQASKDRIKLQQKKLLAFPKGISNNVIAPNLLAKDSSGTIYGYTMSYVDGEVLLRYSEPGFRNSGIDSNVVPKIFDNLWSTVSLVHNKNVIIGDFNDLNIIVTPDHKSCYIIDADSFSFGKFLCGTFTNKFVDPLLCNSSMILARPHTANSDWYAYCVMLMQSLLFVDPYSGVYAPKDKNKKIPHPQRPLHRITVFNPEVRYPKNAIPFGYLPDDLLQYFHMVFEKNQRGIFPRNLLDIEWKVCYNCGTEHARAICPQCSTSTGVVETLTISGSVTARKIFATTGNILFAVFQNGSIKYLYHEDKKYLREGNKFVAGGDLNPKIRYRISGEETLLGNGSQLASVGIIRDHTLGPIITNTFAGYTVFDANYRSRYWVEYGNLYKDGEFGSAKLIGKVVNDNTMFWVGDDFGFGFYRSGYINVYFTFNDSGLNDSISLPAIPGQFIDSSCVFGKDVCWFFVTYRAGGKTINRCTSIRKNGEVLRTIESESGGNDWLGNIRGKCGAGTYLMSATDDGIVRITDDLREDAKFPDTEPFVKSTSNLFAGNGGIYIVSEKNIQFLTIR